MDIDELRKLTLPKLKEHAKKTTDLKGIGGMKKEDLVKAIAKAEGTSDKASAEDHASISSVKQEIHALKTLGAKEVRELLTSSKDWIKLKKVRRKIKRLKRLTRQMALKAKQEAKVASPAEPESKSTPESPPAPEGAAPPETPAAPESPPAASG